MSFISYAQNAEDVLLWRALGHIKNGFYIDVGANDPVEHSVTKAFYDAGWHGINIEPLPAFHQAFLDQRPRDVNLAVAAGARDGSVTLFDVPAVNGWASSDAAVADAHRADGFEVTELTVPLRTLAGICAEHARDEIHFLKVDVEGFEGEVLRGMDLVKWRPWILVIEATLPNSRVTNHQAWEALVTGKGYRYAWFDGLNRYYVADEHAELLDALTIQPNVFDAFISHHLDKAWRATKQASAAGDEARQRAAAAEGKQGDAEKRSEAAIAAAHQASELSRQLLDKFEHASAQAQQELAGKMAAQQQAAALQDELHAANAQGDRMQLALAAAQTQAAARKHELQVALDAANAQAGRLQLELEAAQTQAAALGHELQVALTNGHHVSQWAHGLEQTVLAMRASTSWRITGPWRAAGGKLHPLRRAGLLRRLVVRITANERMRRLLIPLMLRFPALGQRVAQTVSTIKQATPPAAAPQEIAVPEALKALPVSARRVLGDLKRALRHSQGH